MRGEGYRRWLAGCALLLLPGSLLGELAIRPLDRIEVRGGGWLPKGELERLLDLEVGQPATPERVRRTLQRVRAARVASDAAVFLEERSGVQVATVVLWPEVLVEEIRWDGAWPLRRAELERKVPFRPGDPLREDRVLQGLYGLEALLRERGYVEARARLRVESRPSREGSGRAIVAYGFPETPRWTVGRVDLLGISEREGRDLKKALRLRPGAVLRPGQLPEEGERLRALLAREGYRRATVLLEREHRDEARHEVDLAWRIDKGPRVTLVVDGLDARTVRRRNLLSVGPEEGLDETAIQETRSRIRSYLQQRGHFRAEVLVETTSKEGLETVRFLAQPGPRYTLLEVRFPGAAQVPGRELQARMQTAPRALLRPGSGRLVDEELAADLSNLRSYLALDGFLDSRVGPARVLEKGTDLFLEIPIDEGVRRRVASVEFRGVRSLDRGDLERRLAIVPGGPYHRLRLDQAVEQLRSSYETAGLSETSVQAVVDWVTPSLARVTFVVEEGRARQFGEVLFSGLKRTDPGILRRLVEVETRGPLSELTRLEIQRTLYRLGVFPEVQVEWLDEDDSGGGKKDLVVRVEEGRTGSVAYGVGYDSEAGLRGSLRVAESHLFGRLIALRLDALLAQGDQTLRLSLRQPYLGRTRVQVEGTLFRERQDRPAFDVARRGAQLALARRESRWQAALAFEYRIVELEEASGLSQIPREALAAEVASVVPSLVLDRRDDPIEPRRGWSAFLQFEHAFPLLEADAEFLKAFAQLTGVATPGNWGSLAVSLRAGGLWNQRRPLADGTSGLELVPPAERFFAGGRTTHRAFPRDELGVPGSTLLVGTDGKVVPLGGGGTVLFNLDYRFPLFGGLGGTVFLDGGQVWRELSDARSSDLRWGLGLGLRYLTPIGPLRFEVGWNLDRQPHEAARVWFLSLGNPF